MKLPELDKIFNHIEVEKKIKRFWKENDFYSFQKNSNKEIFSVDTPPPYTSALHLHVGHMMSYSHPDAIIRYQRMKGKNVFYPMGYDDNGLPTERYVEQTHKVNKKTISPQDFRELCLEETSRCRVNYEKIWQTLGLSIDWNLQYSTIDDTSSHASQMSFIDLYEKGKIYRNDDPVQWDTKLHSSLAQADVETITRKGKLYDIAFKSENGNELIISTTRPQFLFACVALYCNPTDERYKKLIGKKAIVPLSNHTVEIKSSNEVKKDFGTGLMMVCTFGDAEDVKKWKEDSLPLRICITIDGKLNDLAGDFEGIAVEEAKSKVVAKLKELDFIRAEKKVDQVIAISERTEVPVEYLPAPQWFIRYMDIKNELLDRGNEINWHPTHLKSRYEDWVNGLKYDWNISRQRFYGVPFPLWFCECGEVILAKKENLPVDPRKDKCHLDKCPKCGSSKITGEQDVMDTWMTSSISPLINSNWSDAPNSFGSKNIYPMSIRVQAHEIIRTWTFYTIVKSHLHTNSVPWKDIVISGHGQNEQGKKISKRHMVKYTDKDGYNPYLPIPVMGKFGADAFRLWAYSARLGTDQKYSEKEMKKGKKTVLKLWNASKFAIGYLGDFEEKKTPTNMPIEDRWILYKLYLTIEEIEKHFGNHDFAMAKESVESFFWNDFCDRYLEMIKERFWNEELFDDKNRYSAQWTLWKVLRKILGLYAPFIPFVTEELYQQIYKPFEKTESIHITDFPKKDETYFNDLKLSDGDTDISFLMDETVGILGVLNLVRKKRTYQKVANSSKLKSLTIHTTTDTIIELRRHILSLCSILRVQKKEQIFFIEGKGMGVDFEVKNDA
ncbi:MAG: valine--tRNA ligase [Alphaproteobacteria bacterium]|nr:MAG: valine--tRNA ligase [Rickettsiaceae bacterium 4572_127]